MHLIEESEQELKKVKEEKETMQREKDRLIELLQENIKSMGQQYENVLSVSKYSNTNLIK